MSNTIPHSFVRPGQVDPDLPPPDNCVRCGLPEREHGARQRLDGSVAVTHVRADGSAVLSPADLGTVLGALQLAADVTDDPAHRYAYAAIRYALGDDRG